MSTDTRPSPPSSTPTDAPRRCFICLNDQLPSDPPDIWVDPCPCTLEAHQDCMQSWVTDCERSNKPLRCPVCKSDIHLVTPFDPVLALNEAFTRRFNRASPLLLLTGSSMGLGLALEAYGIGAMWAVAGREATWKFILGESMKFDAAAGGQVQKRALVLMSAAPVLLTNKLLPSLSMKLALPFVSFYTMYHAMHDPGFFTWPPSPQLAMAILPYIRSTYFNLWRETVLPYEIKLNRQLLGLPPLEENNNNGRNNQNQNNGGQNNNRDEQRNAEGGIMGMLQGLLDVLDPEDEDFEGEDEAGGDMRIIQREVNAGGIAGIELELVIEEVGPEGAEPPAQNAENENEPRDQGAAFEDNDQGVQIIDAWDDALEDGTAQNNDAAQEEEHDAAPAPAIALAPPQAVEPAAPEDHEAPQAPPARRPSLGTILLNISNAFVGALALPVVSFAAGELLRLALPYSWTAKPIGLHRARGLMQEQWGRSVVGGCIYVVVRDAMRVYAKQRKVAAMGTRKVKNVERKRK
ncbi:hypothetical protein NLU13_8919 [Sarocladium strictum]|uniref:RING-type domain-containing protein n=1 Tax=Sarocladium strictum TaxID=5046 RepID=A0AA39G970_SARSR|nr:hypothetical protein NLU13_8919 [Sarocladium strictum]